MGLLISKGDAAAARELLRAGPFSGLRENVRAVSEYAAQRAAAGQEAQVAVAQLAPTFFTRLEALDLLLKSYAGPGKGGSALEPLPIDEATAKLSDTTSALDALLVTVPADVLAESRALVAAAASSATAAALPAGGSSSQPASEKPAIPRGLSKGAQLSEQELQALELLLN